MFKILNRPFPAIENARLRWIIIGFHGAFVAFFLMAFKPFEFYRTTGFSNAQNFGYILGFALTVTTVLLLSELLIWKIIKIPSKNWTVGKTIVLGAWDVSIVILSVFFYINYWSGFENFTYQSLIRISSMTILFSIIPIVISSILLENWWLRQNLDKATNLQSKVENAVFTPPVNDDKITLQSDNNNEWLKIKANQLLYLESVDNYINVVYREKDQVKKQLLRNSLKKLENQLTDNNEIMRCHRSFIVNLKNIKTVDGNSRGLQLYFNNYEDAVPVSRKYVKNILNILEEVQQG